MMLVIDLCLFFVISRAYSVEILLQHYFLHVGQESIGVVVHPDDVYNEPGKPSLFKCIFNDEPAQCLWMKDGKLIADDATTYHLVGHKHFYDCSLQVSLPEASINHTFQCISPETPGVKSVKSRVATLIATDATDEQITPLPLVQDLIDNHFHQSVPILLVNPKDQTIRENSTVTLTCKFDQAPPSCIWVRDGNPLYFQNDDRYTVANQSSGDCSVTIENVNANAEGSYSCESPETFALPSVRSSSARLTITRPPAFISIIYEDLNFTNGEIQPQKETVNVSCVVKDCHPQPKIFWRFRNETIINKLDKVQQGGQSYVTHISIQTEGNMKETLECLVDHPALEEQAQVSVQIIVVPEQRQPVIEYNSTVLPHGETVLIPEGEWLHVKCLSPTSHCQTVTLNWSLGTLDNSTVLQNYTCVSNSKDGKGDAISDLRAVPINDADLYCQVQHVHLGYLLEAKVAVQVFSPLTTVVARFDSAWDSEQLAAMANSTVDMTCEADGNLPTSYRWFFKSHGQEEWEEFAEEKKVAVQVTERGNYSCRAKNSYDPRWLNATNEIHLRLKEAVTSVEASFSQYPDRQVSIPKGGQVSAACVSDGDPPVTFLWYNRLNDSTPWCLMNTSHGNNVTNMHTVSMASDGWYKCAAYNEASLGVEVDSEDLFVTISSQEWRRSSSQVNVVPAFFIFILVFIIISTAS